VDGGIVRRNVSNQQGSFVMNFTSPWRIMPRFVTVGQSYQSTGDYNYMAGSTLVTASMHGDGAIVAIENVQTAFGNFQALKVSVTLLNSENFAGGWSQTTETDTAWFVRGIGMVKFYATASYSDSFGNNQSYVLDYSLHSSNQPLPNVPVLP